VNPSRRQRARAAAVVRTADKVDGVLAVGGVPPDLVANVNGSPAYVLDEADFRARARAFKDAFATSTSTTPARPSCVRRSRAGWPRRGSASTSAPAANSPSPLRAGFPMERIGFHGNNKTERRAQSAPSPSASGGSSSTPSTRSSDWRRGAEAWGGEPPRDGPRDRGRRGAHPRIHRDRARRPEVRLLHCRAAAAFAAVQKIQVLADGLELLGLHSHIGSADLRHQRLRGCRQTGAHLACTRVVRRTRHRDARARPRRRLRDRLHHPGRPGGPRAQLASEIATIVEHECRVGIAKPRLSIEPGRAIVGPAMCTVYTVGTVKRWQLDGGAKRTYVSVDGGMSDNIRTALYDADYSCTLAKSRRVRSRARSEPRGGQALRVRRHRGQGRVPARRRAPGDLVAVPGTGRLLPIDGLELQPCAASSGDRSAGRCDRQSSCGARLWTTCWHSTMDWTCMTHE
jgi:diaminopimelate decarboxylase